MDICILLEADGNESKEVPLMARNLAQFALKKTIDDDTLSSECSLSYSGTGSLSHYSLAVTISKNAYSNPRYAMHYKKYCIKNNLDFDMIDKEFLMSNGTTIKFVGSCIRNKVINAIYKEKDKLFSVTLSGFMSKIKPII